MERNSFLVDALGGGIASAVDTTIKAPFTRVGLLLQVQPAQPRIPPRQRFAGSLDCLRRITETEGWPALWRGNSAAVLRAFPAAALTGVLRQSVDKVVLEGAGAGRDSFVARLLSGTASGALVLLLIHPIDTLRIRLVADVGVEDEREFKGLRDSAAAVWNADGIGGFYRGFGLAVLGIAVYRGVFYLVYRAGKEAAEEVGGGLATLGVVATIAAGIVSYPMDTIRARLVMEAGRESRERMGVVECARRIRDEEGASAFFAGIQVKLLGGFATSLLLLAIAKARNSH